MNFTGEQVIKLIKAKIEMIKEDWERFPPQYCGHEEVEVQEREKDAKIDVLNEIIFYFED